LRWERGFANDPAKAGWTIGVARRYLAAWAVAGLAVAALGLAPLAGWCRRRWPARLLTGQAADYADGLAPSKSSPAVADAREAQDAAGETV